MFSMNLVTLDSYQSAPLLGLDVTFSDFRGSEIKQVPVIRIFGSTLSGIKTCLHVHGVFPYMYVPCTVDHNVDSFMYKLAAATDSAINISFGSSVSNTHHVYKIQRVSGIPLYGYHKKEHLYFKIYFYNPAIIKRAADLLQNGTILGQSLQPHEAHIPFILQFMMDYNLYGMSLINLNQIKVRQNVYIGMKEESQDESMLHLFDSQKYLPISITKHSTCKLEVDTQATDILNRQEIQNGIDLNPGIAAIWNEESHRRKVKGIENVESQLLYTNNENRVYDKTKNDIYQEERLLRRLQFVMQTSEDISSVSSKSLSYPLEAEDDCNLLNASNVLNHYDLSIPSGRSKNQLSGNEELQREEIVSKENLSQNKITDYSILDEDDLFLADMLDGLAKENEVEENVDNDSVLGSQYSANDNQVKEQNDDDELEDLNITSIDLESLSSWNTITNVASPSIKTDLENDAQRQKETGCTSKQSSQESFSIEVPQYDGPIDLSSREMCCRPKCKKNEDFLRLKTTQIKQPSMCVYKSFHKLDHQDLDVYDIDELKCIPNLNDYKQVSVDIEKNSSLPNHEMCGTTNYSNLNNIIISAFDGNTVVSSSDSELEQDVTIQKEEKRICTYKSCTKSKNENNVVKASLKRQKIELEDKILRTPQKKTNTMVEPGPSGLQCTPSKSRIGQSPQSSARKYSPLNVTIISPKTSKNNEITGSPTSTYRTPKQNREYLRVSLFREKVNNLGLEKIDPINNEAVQDNYTPDATEKRSSVNMEEDEMSISLTPKSNKEIRKRLSFINTNEDDAGCKSDHLGENKCYSLPLADEDINHSFGDINSDIINKTDLSQHKCPINIHREIPEEDIIHQTVPIKESNEDNDEEDVCNMTYTQLLSNKLKSQLDSSVSTPIGSIKDIVEDKLVTITTRFNPPSRERIERSMKTYSISSSKSDRPFFSNKDDLIKQKGNSSKNNDVDSFKCTVDNVTGIKLWRRMKINEFYPSGSCIKSSNIRRALAGYNVLVIHPLIEPPKPKCVKMWLRVKKHLIAECNKQNGKEDNINNVKESKESTILDGTSGDNQRGKGHSQKSNTSLYSSESNNSVNASLKEMLENPHLYKNNETPQYLGISYGQIEYSLKNHSGDVENENQQIARGLTVRQYLTVLSVEVHVVTRDKLLPNPEQDSIDAIFYAIHNDTALSSNDQTLEHGVIIANSSVKNSKIRKLYSAGTSCSMSYVFSEQELLNSLIILVKHCDPDILLGWEVESLSWGYIFQRASHIGMKNFPWQISRISNVTQTPKAHASENENFNDAKIPGRIMLDVWRIMRHEIALLCYSFENVMYNVMRERISCPTFQTLTEWWKHGSITMQWKVIMHYVTRVTGTLRILMHLDIIGRTCEHAKLIGIQFYEVFSRGSQFRVESMMLRLAKPLNYIPVSPSVQQRARMRAPESLPLIMEPQSMFYTDPLIVLDFQSLYPSIIIAYNYCFSTCLGRVEHIGCSEPYEFGAATLKLHKNTAKKLLGKINFAPCGVAFVKPEVRVGILPRMLTEILNTRLMVKQSMKVHANDNPVLQRVLHSQQLGLKLIANVTYGYTAANYSGRMPCIEVGDSVVSKGRETLERAIKIVEATPKWGAQVVYGDTDSLFILLPGKSRKEAFTIGAEIADTVTAANPPPVKLKFEKVLQPSILQTKKRYCGYMYETPEQLEPEYFAKGIETVRRDGCPAVSKILERTLKILFDTKDLSLVKRYVVRQFDKILRRKISIQDLTFAKEFRGLHGYKPTACVPALELTKRLMKKDPRFMPRVGERVRYVIVAGAPNQPLIQCVRSPMEVILDEGLSPNSIYYITKVIIPPLNRCLNLIDIDVNTWYREMAHRQTPNKTVSLCTDKQKLTIKQFFNSTACTVCGEQTQKDICTNCVAKPSETTAILYEKLRWLERTYHNLTTICYSCIGSRDELKCQSLDCPVFYRLMEARRDLAQIPHINNILHNEYPI